MRNLNIYGGIDVEKGQKVGKENKKGYLRDEEEK